MNTRRPLGMRLFLLSTLAAATVATPLARIACPPAYAADRSEKDIESAKTSLLVPVDLPEGAQRASNPQDLAKFDTLLQQIAQTNAGRMERTEVLIWRSQNAAAAMRDLPRRLKATGYGYADRPAFTGEPGRITPFCAVRPDRPDGLLGLWIETDDHYLLLAWGVYQPHNAQKPGQPAEAHIAAAKPAPPKTSVAARTTPKSAPTVTPAQKRAQALKRYYDAQYIMHTGPITGPMFSSRW